MPKEHDPKRAGLARFLVDNKLKAYPLEMEAGTSEGVIRAYVSGRSKTMEDLTWERLARGASALLKRPVSQAEVKGEFSPDSLVAVESYVGAGAEIFPIDGDGAADYVAPPPSDHPLQAAIVQGDSGAPMFEAGDVLFYPAPGQIVTSLVGRVAIVQVHEGPRLVKRLQRGTRRDRYHLVSINPAVAPLEDRRVESAAPIRWVRRAS